MADLILGINFLQIILHLLNFFILGLGLYILLYKPVKDFMEKRQGHYEELERSANLALEEAEKTKNENKLRLDSVNEEILSLKQKAQKEAEEKARKTIELARLEERKIIEKAKQNAVFEREKILKDTKDELRDLVMEAIEKSATGQEDVFDSFIEASSKEA